MAICLGDDGTLDTVLCCTECGEEMRFNAPDELHMPNGSADANSADCETGNCNCYDIWVNECIAEITAEHTCNAQDDDDAQPQVQS